jgi:hypothetical protein
VIASDRKIFQRTPRRVKIPTDNSFYPTIYSKAYSPQERGAATTIVTRSARFEKCQQRCGLHGHVRGNHRVENIRTVANRFETQCSQGRSVPLLSQFQITDLIRYVRQ